MNTILLKSISIAVSILALSLGSFTSKSFAAGKKNVDCPSESLQHAVDVAKPGWTINVTGTCEEKIVVSTDNVTIDGGGTAIIDGSGLGPGPLVSVQANNVSILNLTIQGSVGSGIAVERSGSAVIQGCTVIDNAPGILVETGSYAQIGAGSGESHSIADGSAPGNLIQGNSIYGIAVRGSANASILHNLLKNNRRSINVTNAGSANIDGNKIVNNRSGGRGRGISLLTNGSVRLSADDSDGHANLIEENDIGIRCRLGGAADGTVSQNFGSGNPGSTDHSKDADITGSCSISSSLGLP